MSEAAAPNPAWRRFPPVAPARLLSDDRLARRAAEGETRAFEEIYDRYAQRLYRFCLAMLGNPQDAQDALQNTMVKALRALPGEERRIQLKPWLYRIARNESVELMRRRPASVEVEPDQTQSIGELESTVETRERLRALMGDLEELPERQRAALVMRELAGLGFEQIGDAFDTSAAVARQTVYEARLSLRQMEAGRELSCREVMRELSDMDGRVARRRELRAHLRSCADCRAFREAISTRHADLGAIAPLPAAASAAILSGVLGTGTASGAVGSTAGAGLAGTLGAGAGKVVSASAIVKSATAVAVVAAVGVGADRSGLIELPTTVGGGDSAEQTPGHVSPPGKAGLRRTEDSGTATGAARTGSGNGSAARSGGKEGAGKAQRGDPPPAKGRKRAGGNAGRRARGHGRAHGTGKPESLPPAAGRGQETAATRKAPQARSEPGPAGTPRGGSSAPTKPSPPRAAPPAASPPQKESITPTPGPPESPGTQAKGGDEVLPLP
ncbi:MAG TPA: sigma-70 family RNA polymerase sigma factor [Solirubrobacterales bacterium]